MFLKPGYIIFSSNAGIHDHCGFYACNRLSFYSLNENLTLTAGTSILNIINKL